MNIEYVRHGNILAFGRFMERRAHGSSFRRSQGRRLTKNEWSSNRPAGVRARFVLFGGVPVIRGKPLCALARTGV